MPSRAHLSSATDQWPTPQDFYARLNSEFSFVLDVCASNENAKTPAYYALDHTDPTRRDGLGQDWAAEAARLGGGAWMNPPYGRPIGAWMAKARQSAAGGATVVTLVPVRADTVWWHEHVLTSGAEVRYVRGRLTFGAATNTAAFASAVVIYRPSDIAGQPGPVGTMTAKPRNRPAQTPDSPPDRFGQGVARPNRPSASDATAEPVRRLVPPTSESRTATLPSESPVRPTPEGRRPLSVGSACIAAGSDRATPATHEEQSMNAHDLVDPNGAGTDPTRGLAQRTATTITHLWAQDGPPLDGPVRRWEPERVLATCAQVHQSWPGRPRGRFATAAVQRLLGTVIGYGRILHPPLGWTLVSGGPTTETGSAPVLVWKNDTTSALVVDVLRAPVQCGALLDDAARHALNAWTPARGVAATRVVDLHAPRRTMVLINDRVDSRFELRPELLWADLNPNATPAAGSLAALVVVA
jgi:phage N-6-adenine-methyltransferase